MFIATFYTHFGAQQFFNLCKQDDDSACMMPVPRALSAACGICVRFDRDRTASVESSPPEDLEALYRLDEREYTCLLRTE